MRPSGGRSRAFNLGGRRVRLPGTEGRRRPRHAVRSPKRRDYDEDGIYEEFGIAPRSIPDWLALSTRPAEHREAASLYRTPATLRLVVPITQSLDDLEQRGPAPELEPFCREIGFERFVDRFRTPR